jgi:hypothetical protein
VDILLWIAMPLAVAVSSALLTYVLMQDKVELAVAREREHSAGIRALLEAQKETFEERIRAVQELARCRAELEFGLRPAPVSVEARLLE